MLTDRRIKIGLGGSRNDTAVPGGRCGSSAETTGALAPGTGQVCPDMPQVDIDRFEWQSVHESHSTAVTRSCAAGSPSRGSCTAWPDSITICDASRAVAGVPAHMSDTATRAHSVDRAN